MKKNKIAGLLIAAAGSIASISAAAALYVKSADSIGFGIGAKWKGLEGTISYTIGGETTGTAEAHYLDGDGVNGGEGFGGAYTQAHYSFAVGASFSSDVPAQNFIVGNFEVKLSNVAETLVNHSKIWVCVNGYTKDSWGESQYKTCFMTSDKAIDADEVSVNHDIAVSSSGAQTVDVYVKLDAPLTEAQTISLAESKAFDIEVTWAKAKNFEFAHVVGKTTMFEEDDVYAMMPNINANSFEWVFNNLPGSMEESKCRKGDTWSADVTNQEDPECKNTKLDSSKTYDVYWTGGAGATANYIEQE